MADGLGALRGSNSIADRVIQTDVLVDENLVEPEDSRNPAGRIRVHRMRVGYGERPNVVCWSCDPASNISEVVTAICALSGQYVPPLSSSPRLPVIISSKKVCRVRGSRPRMARRVTALPIRQMIIDVVIAKLRRSTPANTPKDNKKGRRPEGPPCSQMRPQLLWQEQAVQAFSCRPACLPPGALGR